MRTRQLKYNFLHELSFAGDRRMVQIFTNGSRLHDWGFILSHVNASQVFPWALGF